MFEGDRSKYKNYKRRVKRYQHLVGKKGTGLGLTIVRYIMEAHGGRVGIDSRQGEGTTFSLHFPLAFVPPGSPSG